MLPHGGRPAETPRATTDARCSPNASTVSETAIRPSRSALPLRSSRCSTATPASSYDVSPGPFAATSAGSLLRTRGPNASSAA